MSEQTPCGRCGHLVGFLAGVPESYNCGYSAINNVRYCHPNVAGHPDCYTLACQDMDWSRRNITQVDTSGQFDEWIFDHHFAEGQEVEILPAPEPSAADVAEYVLARMQDVEFRLRFQAAIEGRF